jgi:two-component sensor histidine kinase
MNGDRTTSLLALAPVQGSVGRARRWLTDLLDPDHAESQIEQDAVLVLSELVTNSLRHAHGTVACQVAVSPQAIEIAVIDADPQVPFLRPSDPAREGGFGLRIVTGLSSQWGVAEFASGKAVWARFVAAQPDSRSEPVDRVEADGGNHGEHDLDPPS